MLLAEAQDDLETLQPTETLEVSLKLLQLIIPCIGILRTLLPLCKLFFELLIRSKKGVDVKVVRLLAKVMLDHMPGHSTHHSQASLLFFSCRSCLNLRLLTQSLHVDLLLLELMLDIASLLLKLD